MEFENFNIDEPYDENHLNSYSELISLLKNIDDKIINYRFILSGGFLIFNMLKKVNSSARYQDIDLFFEFKEDFDKLNCYLLEVFNEKQISHTTYVTENAITYTILALNNNSMKLQLIQSKFLSKEDLLSTFDLENCQIAMDNQGNLCMNASFETLYWRKEIKLNTVILKYIEKNGILYLFTLLNRLNKYYYRYSLTNINKETLALIEKIERDYAEEIKSIEKQTFSIMTSAGSTEQITACLFEEWTNFFSIFFKKYSTETDWILTKSKFIEKDKTMEIQDEANML